MEVISTIIPVFAVVIIGWLAQRKGFMPPEFLGPANRLTYYLAIPVLIFQSISQASFATEFHGKIVILTLSAASIAYCGAWLVSRMTRWPTERIGPFIQCAAHGNHGYVGLPIAFYFLGKSGLVKAGIIAGFLMILQNVLSVLALQAHAAAGQSRAGSGLIVRKLITNPVIVSALAGVCVSAAQVPIPTVVQRILSILGGLAPPIALLLIGASLSFEVMRRNFVPVFFAVAIKILALPAVGLLLFWLFKIDKAEFLPGLILLATPTATVSYVMAKEMHGDADFAVAAISLSTLLSATTYIFWLTVIST